MVSANHWLRGIKTYRLSWFLTLVSANHASSNWAQNAMDTLNVRTAHWVTKVPWHGGNSGQLSTGKLICSRGLLMSSCFCQDRQGTIVSIDQTKLKGRDLFNLNFRYRVKHMDNLLSFFPRNLEIPRIFCSIGHTISPNARPKFLTLAFSE